MKCCLSALSELDSLRPFSRPRGDGEKGRFDMAALAFRALSGFLGPFSFGKDKVAITASGRDNAQVAGPLQLFEMAVDLLFG